MKGATSGSAATLRVPALNRPPDNDKAVLTASGAKATVEHVASTPTWRLPAAVVGLRPTGDVYVAPTTVVPGSLPGALDAVQGAGW